MASACGGCDGRPPRQAGWPWRDAFRLINGAGEGGQMSPSPILDHEVELAYLDSDQRWIATVSNGSIAWDVLTIWHGSFTPGSRRVLQRRARQGLGIKRQP